MNKQVQSFIIFILILVLLNVIFSGMDWGIHISIVGSVVLTLVIIGIMTLLDKNRR
tara:strand:+ start:840 stop:1007 length:168 start_codon:yes stop_codon:yes gene_type:complete